MQHFNTVPNSFDSVLDTLFERLVNDRNFRKEFFDDPIESLKKIGIEPTSAIVEFLTNFNWTGINKDLTSFNEKLVLCSSSGY